MSRREDIETSFWSDPDVLELSGIARAVYVWAFTNQRCGMAGVYKVAKAAMQLETGWTTEQLDAALAELEAGRFLFFDGRVMWVRARVKRLRTKSPSIAKAIRNDLDAIGDHPFIDSFRDEYASSGWLLEGPTQAPREPYATPSTPPRDPQETPTAAPCDPHGGSQGSGRGKGTGKGKDNGGGGVGGGGASDSEPDLTHPALDDRLSEVVPILEAARDPDGQALAVEPMAVDSALKAWPDQDVRSAAHEVASWVAEGTARSIHAATLLRAALGRREKREAIAASPRREHPADRRDHDLAAMAARFAAEDGEA